MLSGIFRGKKNKTELAIVFDIGSASVGAALVNLSYIEKPLILYTVRKNMAFSSEVEPEKLLASMRRALKSTALDIQKNGLKRLKFSSMGSKKISSIYCTFSAPWYLAQPKHLMNAFKEEKVIDQKFVDKILEKEENIFMEDAVREYSKKDKNDLYMLEHVLTNVQIDGYDIKKIRGQRTKDLEMSIFSSMIPERVAESTIDSISSVFHIKNLHLHSFALTSFGVVRDILGKESFLLIDISGEVTEANLVHEGRIAESGTFPFGVHTFARKLSNKLKTNTEDVLSRISLKESDESSVLVFGDAEKQIIEGVEKEWTDEFVSLMDEFSKSSTISPNVVFITDKPFRRFFERVLVKDDIAKSISYGFKPNISMIDEDFLSPHIHIGKGVKGDAFLSIGTLFFNTSHKNYDEKDLATFQN